MVVGYVLHMPDIINLGKIRDCEFGVPIAAPLMEVHQDAAVVWIALRHLRAPHKADTLSSATVQATPISSDDVENSVSAWFMPTANQLKDTDNIMNLSPLIVALSFMTRGFHSVRPNDSWLAININN